MRVGPTRRAERLANLLSAGQVLFSLLWLRRSKAGPLEWVWRRLTYR